MLGNNVVADTGPTEPDLWMDRSSNQPWTNICVLETDAQKTHSHSSGSDVFITSAPEHV